MSRIGEACGAQAATFMGLSGLGDLALTCTGDLSRNRQVGLRLGQGESLEHITSSLGMVAEGVKTTSAVYDLARAAGRGDAGDRYRPGGCCTGANPPAKRSCV